MTTPRPDSRLGTDLGPYRIERVLGRGGMGVVYLAEQRDLGRKVALKLLAPDFADDEAFRARFLRESHLAASIDHANIIPIYEAGEADGTYYLAMRYVEGTDLDERLRAGPLDPALTIALLAQVAGALDAAHARGLVHRDVKPANLLLADEGGEVPHVYLTDFGLTKKRASQSGLTRAGSTLGTLEYMAPEQVEGGAVDAPADEYALACVAFQCLTGRVPFPRESDVAVAMAHLHDEPPSAVALRPELPAGVDAVLARGMAKDRDARYPTCLAFVTALREALGGRLVGAAGRGFTALTTSSSGCGRHARRRDRRPGRPGSGVRIDRTWIELAFTGGIRLDGSLIERRAVGCGHLSEPGRSGAHRGIARRSAGCAAFAGPWQMSAGRAEHRAPPSQA